MPNQALWPKEVRPVKPTRRLRPSAAIARHTICEAVLVDRLSAFTTNGSSASPKSPIQSARFFIRRISFKFLDALAQKAARAEHQDEEHQDVHRGLARGGREVDSDA